MRQIHLTSDGSHTIFDSDLNTHFHSINGAIAESQQIFIKHGLEYQSKRKNLVRIFELGYGTGLNAYLSYLYAIAGGIEIYYHAIDLFPLQSDLNCELNYEKFLKTTDMSFNEFTQLPWNNYSQVHPLFKIFKQQIALESFSTIETFDLVYYDAFDPVTQPELWTIEIFEKIYQMMSPEAILCTYCAKGLIKRNLKSAGFAIEALPGAPGKREMTRAKRL
jgi:tRNA U34 5-methylaminomethyl-2-thiouridine-forming methyltransferase MnmC